MEKSKHLVIIGGVAAGTKAASKARRENRGLKITLYNEDKYISYSACGLPYYIQDVIKDKDELLVRSPEEFKTKENIDIHTLYKVTKIIPQKNIVIVRNLETQEELEDQYDYLLLATGSSSIIPRMEGINLKNVFTLKTFENGVKIKDRIKDSQKAVIIGAGYIGMELAEAFHSWKIDTTVIERAPQILGTFDYDLALQVQKHVEEKGIKILTDETVKRLVGDEDGNFSGIETESGKFIESDTAVIAVGVKPNVEIAKNAGIEIGQTGAIKVDFRMKTNFDNIYAAGDCAETINRLTGKPVWVPLGSTANKQGRVAAINITGGYAEFEGVLGSLVVKVFDFTASKAGLSEKQAQEEGFEYEMAIVPHSDRSGYMPQSRDIVLKVIAEKGSGRLLGIQAIGEGDADKRVNIMAAALTSEMNIQELLNTDLTYAPPYSSAIDPLLIAAQILESKFKKEGLGISPAELQKTLEEEKPCCVIDVRNPDDYKIWHLDDAKNISLEELEELAIRQNPENIIIYCEEGMQSYLASVKLTEKGCKNIRFIDGGINYFKNIIEKFGVNIKNVR